MSNLEFQWDPGKAHANARKHGVTFTEAATVFSDENGILIADPDHFCEEERFILLGMSWSLRLLVVCHCYRVESDVICIICARKASRAERAQYTVV
jgi:uncharacterized DUF497 family protein